MQRVTMQDVATLAGVAISTVSLYLRKPAQVMPDTGARVAEAIEQLGYVQNMMAGGLAAASTRAVSLIVPSLRNAFFSETADILQAELGREGVQLLLGHTEYDPRREEALVRASLAWAPAALVLTGLDHNRATRQLLFSRDTPVIEIWELGGPPIDMAVGFDHRAVGAAAAHHLIRRGCRTPAFLGARLDEDRRASQRGEGFAAALLGRDVRPALRLADPGPATVAAGARLLATALRDAPDLDAVACSNDWIALGVLFECQRQGVEVPGRLKVIGFGDLPFAADTIPPLSTVRPAGAAIGRETARLALARLMETALTDADKVIDVGFELVPRAST
jgi:LacI family gluconate utilization system Gnt-I transcriptional repressor